MDLVLVDNMARARHKSESSARWQQKGCQIF